MIPVKLRIHRFNPETDTKPHWETYTVEVEPTDRVLDALQAVKHTCDGSLTLRFSCMHGICGSDAMKINGRNHLACKVLVKDCKQPITVEPMGGMRVIKDLVVDMEPFFAKFRSVQPYLAAGAPPEKERLQSPEERARFEDTTKCILCGACTTACASFWTNPDYVGPAAIVAAHRFIFDSRDEAAQERLPLLNAHDGVWRCRTVFNCVEACPREIKITEAIADVKRALVFKKK